MKSTHIPVLAGELIDVSEPAEQSPHDSQLDAWDRTMRAHWHIRRFTREDLAEAQRLLSA